MKNLSLLHKGSRQGGREGSAAICCSLKVSVLLALNWALLGNKSCKVVFSTEGATIKSEDMTVSCHQNPFSAKLCGLS